MVIARRIVDNEKILEKSPIAPIGKVFLTYFCLFCLIFAGCRPVKKPDVNSLVDVPKSFSDSGSFVLADRWWESFNDPRLNVLIEKALSDSFTIRSAWDRLSQAEQLAVQAGASLLPEVEYDGQAKRSRQDTRNNVTYTNNYSLGLNISYEVDLWGRVRSAQQAAVLDAQAAEEDVRTAAITLSSTIAKTWYQLAEAKQQEIVINEQLDTNQKVLDIITSQFNNAQINAADVFRQRQLVESSRGQLIQSQENIVLLQHKLSIFIGKNPQKYWVEDQIELFEPGQLPAISVPGEVLQRRPDVLNAYRAIEAADRRVASAVADQYPRISISSTVETSVSRVRDLFDDWLANLAANAVGPLFDAGLRKAEVKRTQAVLSESINNYSQTVLEALKEVEDAINKEYYQRQYISNLQKQLKLARQTSESTKLNYINGQMDYIRVLEAFVSKQSLELSELAARRTLVEHRIDLCRAIAGSWQLERPQQAQIQ